MVDLGKKTLNLRCMCLQCLGEKYVTGKIQEAMRREEYSGGYEKERITNLVAIALPSSGEQPEQPGLEQNY